MNRETAPHAAVRQNLVDADCSSELIERIMALHMADDTPEQFALLEAHRQILLGHLRHNQYAMNCLGYLLFSMKKAGGRKG